MAYTYSKIATVTVGSGGISSIEFLSIPQNYTDLLILISARASSGTPELRLNFNNSSTNFTTRYMQGSGSTVISNNVSYGYIGEAAYSTYTSNTFSNASVYIPNYTSINYKSFMADKVAENNATAAYSELTANLWSNTSAINSISLYCSGSINLAQYSTATLYGIKAEV